MLGGVPGRGLPPVPAQPSCHPVEELGLGPPHHVGGEVAQDPRHHRQVLHVVVGLEQSVALQQNTVNIKEGELQMDYSIYG